MDHIFLSYFTLFHISYHISYHIISCLILHHIILYSNKWCICTYFIYIYISYVQIKQFYSDVSTLNPDPSMATELRIEVMAWRVIYPMVLRECDYYTLHSMLVWQRRSLETTGIIRGWMLLDIWNCLIFYLLQIHYVISATPFISTPLSYAK